MLFLPRLPCQFYEQAVLTRFISSIMVAVFRTGQTMCSISLPPAGMELTFKGGGGGCFLKEFVFPLFPWVYLMHGSLTV